MKHLISFLAALLLGPLAISASEPPPFRYDAPAGPQFSDAEKQTQRDKGAGVVPLVQKAFEEGAAVVKIPPGDYRFGKERWDRDGVNYQRLLIQSGPGTVRNCWFARQGCGIEINSDFPYIEGGVAHDITITDTMFVDVNPQPSGAAVSMHTHTYNGGAPPFSNIVITGNTFIRPGSAAIRRPSVVPLRWSPGSAERRRRHDVPRPFPPPRTRRPAAWRRPARGFFGMNFFGGSYELPAPFEGWLLFLIAMLTMIITPIVLYTLLKQYVRRGKL